MLRKIRIITAVVFFTFITLLFLDFTGSVHNLFGALAKIQFIPALLALNAGIIAGLVLLTLVFGRIYCSVICPLGVFQDAVSWVAGKRKKFRFSYSPSLKWVRYGFLALFVVSIVAGIGSVSVLLDPYSSYGRIASNLFAPLYQWGNNLLAYFAERTDSYAFYTVDVWIKSVGTLIITSVTLMIIVILAWRNGRSYCNSICPVGTILGFFSGFSLFKPYIDTARCNSCGLCARSCKAACIDPDRHEIDYSRCVVCFDCIKNCRHNAIKYQYRKKIKKSDETKKTELITDYSRRNFFTAATLLATTTALKAQEKKVDGGLAVIENKKIPKRSTPVVPPGSHSIRNFTKHCTGCQLCVSVCPNQVLRPSDSLDRFMQPEISYERGYCRPECTKCSEVCPTGAIIRISSAEKSSIQTGHAVWIKSNCVVLNDNVDCGNCAKHCPTGAIQMIQSEPGYSDSPKIPVVNAERCIGCGACENLCPARPFSAIYVEGHEMHRTV